MRQSDGGSESECAEGEKAAGEDVARPGGVDRRDLRRFDPHLL